ncbi:MAG: DsbE family thiol:disulfide interchange protein [Rhizobiales bacterium]|nr:DsbE family thiol:disulfide interchange protein [Hyphomicrobiales bacterium]MBI3674283.1 DsbE family thiol:disulfide interchange protein [Hyphomicrobiales bacterium]
MTSPGRAIITALPVILFASLALLFWRGLSGDPSLIPSALIGRPAPEVTLPPITGSDIPAFDSASLKAGNVTVINVWASWCVPCRTENPLLMELAKRGDIRLVGINYKDDPENARRFLGTLGNPFAAIVADEQGRAAVDWGVYGVPETFVVDGQGIIRFKWIGPLTPEALAGTLKTEIDKAKSPLK